MAKNNKKTAIEEFHEIREKLNNIPNLNRGGCAIAALAMYRWALKNIPLKDIKIVYLFSENPYIEEGMPSCSHAMVKIGKRIYDSDSKEKLKVLKNKYEAVLMPDEEQVVESINDEYWNPMFEREIHLKKIEKITNVKLKDINKEFNCN